MSRIRTTVLSLVVQAAEELNPSLDEAIATHLGEEAPLYGRDGVLDSLDLVSLILLVEEKTAEALGTPVTLTSDRALSSFRSPFRTVGSLTDYVVALAEPTRAAA
ncbi:MAG: acyl carrier protein [Myxococcales bacterium]|nr:MAG: acyl carrier protein [Myxococcales bacterium]